MDNEEEYKRNKSKISNSYINKNGKLIRDVDGVEIIQIEEKTLKDVRMNEAINLWRTRTK
tara:strand:+ start:504 stop:683 length:180 start_codon:yes stop_codon:yes gene_type:complete